MANYWSEIVKVSYYKYSAPSVSDDSVEFLSRSWHQKLESIGYDLPLVGWRYFNRTMAYDRWETDTRP